MIQGSVALYYMIQESTIEINDWRIQPPHTAVVSLMWLFSVVRICWSSCGHVAIKALLLNLEWQLLCLITDDRSKASAAAVTRCCNVGHLSLTSAQDVYRYRYRLRAKKSVHRYRVKMTLLGLTLLVISFKHDTIAFYCSLNFLWSSLL